MQMHDASSVVEVFCRAARPRKMMSVTEWADTYRVLPRKAAAASGRYRSSVTPYCVEIMNALGFESGVEEVCWVAATQIGKTEVGNNWIMSTMDQDPCSMQMVFPTDNLARSHSQQKLTPSLEECDVLARKSREERRGRGATSMVVKDFGAGILFLTGSNSTATYRARSIRGLMADDIDGYEEALIEEGDPIDLLRKRTDAFGSRAKRYFASTVTTKVGSKIWRLFQESDQRYYEVPCPHCGEPQSLEWGRNEKLDKDRSYGLKFEKDKHGQVTWAYYVCKHCGAIIEEHHKTQMLRWGKWVPRRPEIFLRRGYHLNGLYSPVGMLTWARICQESVDAKDIPERRQVWMNLRLALPWEGVGEQPDWEIIKRRAGQWDMTELPEWVQLITGGVDVQDNRLAVLLLGWGPREQICFALWTEIFGIPNQPFVWDQLDKIMYRAYPISGGGELPVTGFAVDTGGHFTQEVYNYARRRHPFAMAIKGSGLKTGQIVQRPSSADVSWRGEVIKGGVQLWPLVVNTAKTMIYNRLAIRDPDQQRYGQFWFPANLDDEFYRQLTAERQTVVYKSGYPSYEWVKVYPRNEVLDCTVYAIACGYRHGAQLITDEPEPTRDKRPESPGENEWLDTDEWLSGDDWLG